MKKIVFWTVIALIAYFTGLLDFEGMDPDWSFNRALIGMAIIYAMLAICYLWHRKIKA